uniref:Uncharacterized protein n=1 Tax=Romanomermis culicivorax TaxID=13658 RepID=A0A915IDU5_ROMCU
MQSMLRTKRWSYEASMKAGQLSFREIEREYHVVGGPPHIADYLASHTATPRIRQSYAGLTIERRKFRTLYVQGSHHKFWAVYFGNILDTRAPLDIRPIDKSEGPKAQAPACSQQALEDPLGDPV